MPGVAEERRGGRSGCGIVGAGRFEGEEREVGPLRTLAFP